MTDESHAEDHAIVDVVQWLADSIHSSTDPVGADSFMTVADHSGLNGATGHSIEELANQDANPSSPRLRSAEAMSAGGGDWG